MACSAVVERCGAVVKRRTRDREVPGSIPTNCKCCFLEQETLSTLLSTGFYPGKKRATWKISTRLLNVLPSINKVDYYYYYYYFVSFPYHKRNRCSVTLWTWPILHSLMTHFYINCCIYPVSILRKSISGRHRPVRVADGPMTARCRFT